MSTIRKTVFIIIPILVLIPIIIYVLYWLGPSLPNARDLKNDDWLSFFGGYIGGAIGGIATLIVVYLTVKTVNMKEICNKTSMNLTESLPNCHVLLLFH